MRIIKALVAFAIRLLLVVEAVVITMLGVAFAAELLVSLGMKIERIRLFISPATLLTTFIVVIFVLFVLLGVDVWINDAPDAPPKNSHPGN